MNETIQRFANGDVNNPVEALNNALYMRRKRMEKKSNWGGKKKKTLEWSLEKRVFWVAVQLGGGV